jgi:tetratricopeptide (TPR) repeat protein
MAGVNPLRQIFLSCVTDEFGAHRQLLKGDLSLPGVAVREQQDFVQGGGNLLEKLDRYLSQCDAVIHLVGEKTGHAAKRAEIDWLLAHYPQFLKKFPFLAAELHAAAPAVSYTQLEAWLALFHGRGCYIYRPASFDSRPLAAGDPQLVHWNHLRTLGKDRSTFDDEQHLCRRVLRDLNDLWPNTYPSSPCRLAYPTLGELFIGREEFVTNLRQRFEHVRQSGRWPIQLVHGLGGVGKTRLIVEYAWRYRDHYAAVLMVSADPPEALDRGLAELAGVLLTNDDPTRPQPERVRETLSWLSAHPGWLLLIDNVDTEESRDAVAGRLPSWANGHVLITGRVSSWPRDVKAIDLHVLAPDEAARFLVEATAEERQTQPEDAAVARALANEDLGGLCLALEQAAAYIRERRISLAEYRKRWATNQGHVREWAHKVLMRYREEKGVSLSVATTWQTTFDELSPPARALLEMLSWLAPDPIPEGLLREAETESQLQTHSRDPQADVETAIVELRRYSLLLPSAGCDFVATGQVHRLVQLIVRERLPEESADTSLKAMLAALDACVPREPSDVRTWPVLDPLRPHLLAAIVHAEKLAISQPTTRLQSQLGIQLWSKALYQDAEPLMRRSLAVGEESFGPEHPTVALRLNNLAQLLQATNRLAEAEPLMRRALAIDEKSFGPDHPDVATDLNNLAQLLQDTNRLVEAEPPMRRALAIDEKSFGPEHPNVARDLNNLALLLQATDRLAQAEPLMRRALAIDEKSFGPDHPDVAIDLNNLALLLQDTNRLAEAETLMRRALAMDEKSLGTKHPNVAIRLNNLALLLQATNRLAEAEPLMRRALAIDEKSFGPDHPNVAIRLNNLAQLLQDTNRLAEAEPLLRRALAINERSLGPEHPNVAVLLNNLAQLLQATKRFAAAEPLMRGALAIDVKSFGPEHPDVAIDLNNLAQLLRATNRLAEAEPLMRRHVAILVGFGRATGHEHPHMQAALQNYRSLLEDMNLDQTEIARRLAPFETPPTKSTEADPQT